MGCRFMHGNEWLNALSMHSVCMAIEHATTVPLRVVGFIVSVCRRGAGQRQEACQLANGISGRAPPTGQVGQFGLVGQMGYALCSNFGTRPWQ